MSVGRIVGVVGAIAVLFIASSAHADGLSLATEEYGPWPNAVAALQTELHSEGRAVHVVVRDGAGEIARCGTYSLTLAAPGGAAFVVGACDPSTGATELVLAHRTALF